MPYHVDELTSGYIEGWAQDGSREAVGLSLELNGEKRADVTANRHRADLKQGGLGEGNYGFRMLVDPPMASGDSILILDRETGQVVFEREFVGQVESGLKAALALKEQIAPLETSYWQAVMLELSEDTCFFAGPLLLPAAAKIEDYVAIDPDTGRTFPLSARRVDRQEMERYWFFDGEIYDAKVSVPIGASRSRLAIGPRGETKSFANRNFIAVPGREDLADFRFAGVERATRVAGGDNTLARFAASGLTQALMLSDIASELDRFPANARVFDWGCGAGRVLQPLARIRPEWSIVGADIDAVNLEWCAETLSDIADFNLLPLQPPASFPTDTFDLVYGLSVITHLDLETRAAWIAELARITKPGGYVILTYMGVWAALQCGRGGAALSIYDELYKDGVSDSIRDMALGAELSEYYRASFTSFDSLADAISPHFEIVANYPRALCYHDTLVLRSYPATQP